MTKLEKPVTHKELVERAVRWLKYSVVLDPRHLIGTKPRYKRRCGVIASEMLTGNLEIPDAIGWMNAGAVSVLIECKTSRGDFFADRKKLFRANPHSGVGMFRFFMTPPGLLRIEDLPDKWGLLECSGRTVDVMHVGNEFSERNMRAEMIMLYSVSRRLQNQAQVNQ